MRILASAPGFKLRQDVSTRRLYYWYDCSKMVGSPCSCNFSLLCEVGAPYQEWFKRQIERLGLIVTAVETATDYYECVMIPKLTKGYSHRGADMGRPDSITETSDFPIKFHLVKLRIDSGGYDEGGAYWGLGAPLYRAYGFGTLEAQEMFIRASSREEAKEIVRSEFKTARFYR